MASREELTAALEKIQGELADLDENDYECEVELEGKRTRIRGKTARSWLEKMGIIDKPATGDGDAGDGDGDAGDGDGGRQDEKPKKSGSYFA